jgi:hypothetical protein
MSKGRYVYFQPNEKDIKDGYGDCTIRALCKAMGTTWIEAYMKMLPFCVYFQTPNVFNLPQKLEAECLAALGFEYHGISNKRGSKRPTVDSFAKAHPTGTYILNVANHEVACVDGKYYDTWDCGYKSLYGYYLKVD